MNNHITRKANTGEAGNRGQFGTHTRDADTVKLLPERGAVAPQLSSVMKSGYLDDMATYAVNVTYDGEETRRVQFQGDTTSGGPVVMFTGPHAEHQTVVDDPSRFGPFGPEWVKRFFASSAEH